jgi:hypothetical protein
LSGLNVPAQAVRNRGVHVPRTKDKLLEAIEAVHAAGLDEGLWPNALGAAAGLVRANCVTLETWETQGLRHLGFKGFNVPPADELSYLADFVPLNPRLPIAARHTTGDIFAITHFSPRARWTATPSIWSS